MQPTHRIFIVILLLAGLAACSPAAPAVVSTQPPPTNTVVGETWPTQGWSVSTPEEQGMDAAKLARVAQEVKEPDRKLDSLLIIRHGAIVSETYNGSNHQTTRHELYSVTKSFTSTLVGIAKDQGLIDRLDLPVLSYFPALKPANLDESKSAMTLEDLLTMRSGLDWNEGDPVYRAMYMSSDWTQYVLDLPMSTQPGEKFVYCSGCSHVLSAIVQQAVKKSTGEFADKVLFKPLGITNYAWNNDSQGISIGGWGLQLTPRDMAKLGYLFLHEGNWDGKQIVSADWVKDATQKHTATTGTLGYGYQWWIDADGMGYSARGRYGQVIYVKPELDLIVVATAQAEDDSGIFKLIDEEIIPSISID